MDKSKYNTIRVSRKAYEEIKRRASLSHESGRGGVGVVDQLLFNEYTTNGRKYSRKKSKKVVD